MFDLMPFDHRQKNMFGYLDKLEKDFFGDAVGSFSQFRTDIIEKDDRYILQAELPGFTKEDIHIELEGDYLTIRAEHDAVNEEKQHNFIRRERRYGSFARSFQVSNVKTDEIAASYKDGVLELNMPKRENTPPKNRQIEIK